MVGQRKILILGRTRFPKKIMAITRANSKSEKDFLEFIIIILLIIVIVLGVRLDHRVRRSLLLINKTFRSKRTVELHYLVVKEIKKKGKITLF